MNTIILLKSVLLNHWVYKISIIFKRKKYNLAKFIFTFSLQRLHHMYIDNKGEVCTANALGWLRVNSLKHKPSNIFLFKINNRNTWKRSGIYSKLTIKTSEWRERPCGGVFIVDFELTSLLFQMFLLLTLNT